MAKSKNEPTTAPAIDIFADQAATTEVLSAPTLPGHNRVAVKPDTALPAAPAEVAPSGDELVPPLNIDNPESDAAIDDIVAQEADQVLAAEDAGITLAQNEVEQSAPYNATHSGHPVFWFIVALLAFLAVIAMIVLTSPGLDVPFID